MQIIKQAINAPYWNVQDAQLLTGLRLDVLGDDSLPHGGPGRATNGNFALSDVRATQVGEGTRIWQFCVVLAGARIGRDCNVNAQCLVENDVIVGDRVTVKPGVQLWDGLRVEDDVFIGPNVTFTNDKYPRSRRPPPEFAQTRLRRGASIGANATILCGVEARAEGW